MAPYALRFSGWFLCILILGSLASSEEEAGKSISPGMLEALRQVQEGEPEQGLKALKKLIEDPETSSYDLFMCGELCFTRLRQLETAISAFSALLARGDRARTDLADREIWMARDAMGICLGMSGRFPEAEKTFREAMEFAKALGGTERWESAFNLACTFSEWGKDEQALAALQAYFQGMRSDRWKIDVNKALSDSSFRRFREQEAFKRLIATYSKISGDPARDEIIRVPVAGRTVELLVPGTTRFETEKLPEYAIRFGAAEGTKFHISLNKNDDGGVSLKKYARSRYEKLSEGFERANRKFIAKGAYYILYLKTEQEGVPIGQVSIRAYYRHKDLTLDLHVSALNPTKEDEARMMQMVESVRISQR